MNLRSAAWLESPHRIPLLRVFQWTLSLLLLSALIIYVGPAALVSVLGRVRPVWVLAVVVASFALVLLGAANVWILLRAFSHIEFGAFFHAYVSGWCRDRWATLPKSSCSSATE